MEVAACEFASCPVGPAAPVDISEMRLGRRRWLSFVGTPLGCIVAYRVILLRLMVFWPS